MATIEITAEQESRTGASQAKVKRTSLDGEVSWWVVSSVVAADTGKFETLAFAEAYEEGWAAGHASAGGIGKSREDVIAALADDGFQPPEGACNADELDEELGGPMGVAISTLGMMADDVSRGRVL